jgi:hypothetical protein
VTNPIVARIRVTALYLGSFGLPLLIIAIASGVFA